MVMKVVLILRKENDKNGVIYWHYDSVYSDPEKYGGLIAFSDKKYIVNGGFKLTLVQNSVKFPWGEIQMRIYNPVSADIKPTTRSSASCNTAEINIPAQEIDNIVEILGQFKLILAGKEPTIGIVDNTK